MSGEAQVAVMQYLATSGSHGGGHDTGYSIASPAPSASNILHPVVQQERFKGIRYRPELGRFISEIRPTQPRKRKIWLGTYKTAEEAARAFDAGIFYTKKPIAYNFEDSPSILEPLPENLSPEQEHIEIQKMAKAAAARVQPSQSELQNPCKYTKFSHSYSSQQKSIRHYGDPDNEQHFIRHVPPREIDFTSILW